MATVTSCTLIRDNMTGFTNETIDIIIDTYRQHIKVRALCTILYIHTVTLHPFVHWIYRQSLQANKFNCVFKWLVVKPFCLSTDDKYMHKNVGHDSYLEIPFSPRFLLTRLTWNLRIFFFVFYRYSPLQRPAMIDNLKQGKKKNVWMVL